jgi:hypothetical protein
MSLPLVSRFAVSIDGVVLLRPSVIKIIRSIPGALAEAAAKIASTYRDVFTATILDAAKCRELKMGSYLAVAAASETNPPYFIHLCYKPRGGDVRRKLALVGKGITFDRFVYFQHRILDFWMLDSPLSSPAAATTSRPYRSPPSSS